jgi:uncharacterized protein YbjT (DUF2867 family)
MILVVGATGMVGSEICQRLSRRGEKVRALVRTTSSTEKVALLRGRGAEVWVGDLKDPDSLAGACRGVNAVISTASSILSRQAGDSIESVDDTGQLHLVEAAGLSHTSMNQLAWIVIKFRSAIACEPTRGCGPFRRDWRQAVQARAYSRGGATRAV